jgi:hypothetical protein
VGPWARPDLRLRLAFGDVGVIQSGYAHAVLRETRWRLTILKRPFTAPASDRYLHEGIPPARALPSPRRDQHGQETRIDEATVELGLIKDGIVHACLSRNIPLVLAGSIRDDGPLPGVIADAYRAQDAMREAVRDATTVIALATQLHAIATGNMLPHISFSATRSDPYIFISSTSRNSPWTSWRTEGASRCAES